MISFCCHIYYDIIELNIVIGIIYVVMDFEPRRDTMCVQLWDESHRQCIYCNCETVAYTQLKFYLPCLCSEIIFFTFLFLTSRI